MSIASAQLEEGTILVDPASGNVTSIPSDGGHFAPFQVNPPSGSRARAVRPIRRRSLPQTARRGARAPRRKRAACRASRAPFGPLRFGRCSDVPSLGAFWLCPVCLVLRARACVSDPGQTPCRQDPLNLLFTAAFTVELALNLFAKGWVKRRPPPSGGSRDSGLFAKGWVKSSPPAAIPGTGRSQEAGCRRPPPPVRFRRRAPKTRFGRVLKVFECTSNAWPPAGGAGSSRPRCGSPGAFTVWAESLHFPFFSPPPLGWAEKVDNL